MPSIFLRSILGDRAGTPAYPYIGVRYDRHAGGSGSGRIDLPSLYCWCCIDSGANARVGPTSHTWLCGQFIPLMGVQDVK